MIARNARLILIADVSILLANVISSLVGARALGPAGRGDARVALRAFVAAAVNSDGAGS